MSLFSPGYAFWSIVLVLGVPLTIVMFNELIDRSKRSNNDYTSSLIAFRDLLLPLLVLVVLFRFVFAIPVDNLPVRLLSTAFWGALIVVTFRLSQTLIGSGNHASDNWRSYVPHMFLRLPPYTIIGCIVFHIIQNLWSLPLKELATTLGIGSIVVAFALQDTLSNLVSGLLLVANSPFKTGEWIEVGDIEGKIISVNWRYTIIENWQGDLVVIPNGSIANESISNHSRPTKKTAISKEMEFAFTGSPNKVKTMLMEILNDTPGVLANPKPCVSITSLTDPIVKYDVEFWIADYSEKWDIIDLLLSNLWYATQRHKIALPVKAYTSRSSRQADPIAKRQISDKRIVESLESLLPFGLLSEDARIALAVGARFHLYAIGENIIKKGKREAGVYVVSKGSVQLLAYDKNNTAHELECLSTGAFFGENGLSGRAFSQLGAAALEDSEILVLDHNNVNEALNQHADFSEQFGLRVSRRRSKERRIVGEPKRNTRIAQALESTSTGER